MSYRCSIYGLGFEYDPPLAALAALPQARQTDVRFFAQAMPAEISVWPDTPAFYTSDHLHESGRPAVIARLARDGARVLIEYGDGTRFAVAKDGAQVWATWPDDLTLEDTATYLLGPIMGLVLRLRGVVCLHASAVAVDRHAVAFLGPPGSGKSSLAAAFALAGYSVLSDDVVALRERDGQFWVAPAYPRVRLWPSSCEMFYADAEALPRLTPTWDKRFFDLGRHSAFGHDALPLASAFILSPRTGNGKATIEPLDAREAMFELLSNTYMSYLLGPEHRGREFDVLARLRAAVHVRTLRAGEGRAALMQTCSVVAEEIAGALAATMPP